MDFLNFLLMILPTLIDNLTLIENHRWSLSIFIYNFICFQSAKESRLKLDKIQIPLLQSPIFEFSLNSLYELSLLKLNSFSYQWRHVRFFIYCDKHIMTSCTTITSLSILSRVLFLFCSDNWIWIEFKFEFISDIFSLIRREFKF